MVQSRSNNNQPNSTVLNIENGEFAVAIGERIRIGEELCSRNVTSAELFTQFEEDYKLWHDYNLEYLKQSFNAPANEYRESYEDAGYSFMGQLNEVKGDVVQTRKNLIKNKITSLKALAAKSPLLKSMVSPKATNVGSNSKALDKKHIFIVHGHDELAKVSVARFVEKLGLIPIILHEQSSSGKTIIEKIEEYSNVGFGIALYTACDVGAPKKASTDLHPRARQNVVFEHGYLIGKIGRKNVCALVKGDIETPNDISGVVYVKMGEDESWHLKLAKELRSSGYEIDLNRL